MNNELITHSSHGSIKIDTSPDNLDVYINGKFVGKTPLDIMDVIPGKYIYEIKGYSETNESFVDELNVELRKITKINIDLSTEEKVEEYIDFIQKSIEENEIIENDKKQINNDNENQSSITTSYTDKAILEGIQETNLLLKHMIKSYDQDELFYDTNGTITTAQTSDPNDPDHSNYNTENIFNTYNRKSKKLTIANDGFGDIFVRVSHNGIDYSNEVQIYESDVKVYYNVYSVRLRSNRVGCRYRVTEYSLNNVTVNIQKSERIETISTDKDTHFIDAISVNQMSSINLTGLLSNKVKIVAINGQSKQKLKYRLIFWASETGLASTNLNTNTFLTDVIMDFTDTLSAFRIDTGSGLSDQYYIDVSDLEGLYEDDDENYTLHMSLQNLSASSKSAGSDGEVQFDIKYAMRL